MRYLAGSTRIISKQKYALLRFYILRFYILRFKCDCPVAGGKKHNYPKILSIFTHQTTSPLRR